MVLNRLILIHSSVKIKIKRIPLCAFFHLIIFALNMGVIRKQGIQSSLYIYLGFAIGAFNFWLLPFVLNTEQFGLVRVLVSVSMLAAGICSLGAQPLISRFYPYFDNHGKNQKTDLITWAFAAGLIGYVLFIIFCFFFKGLIIRKFQANAALFVNYFYLVYPFTLSILLFGLMERIAWSRQFTIFSSFLREVASRIFVSLAVIGLALHWLGFNGFIIFYSLQFFFVFLLITYFLFAKENTRFSFRISPVTRRLYKHMVVYTAYNVGGNIFFLVENFFNTILLGSISGLSAAGVYDIASFFSTLLIVPKRGLTSSALASIARAWKERDLGRIERIYQKSSAVLLLSGLLLFGLIWLNLDDIFRLYKPVYSTGKYVVFFIALGKLVDLSTGLSYNILEISKVWKINLFVRIAGIFLFLLVSYLLSSKLGLIGAAYAVCFAFTLYSISRLTLLWWKFKIQPYTIKTLLIVLAALFAYFIAGILLPQTNYIFVNIIIRSLVFVIIFGVSVLWGKLSQDVTEIFDALRNRYWKR